MLCLGIDPSAAAPGYAVWSIGPGHLAGILIHAGTEPPIYRCDVAVVERGWTHGAMGKDGHWGLGFDAGWRLALADAPVKYTIRPKAWRAALGILSSPPKAVIVARLRTLRYAHYLQAAPGLDGGWTDDVVEACGIAEATAILLSRKFKKDRNGLTEVKR